MNYLQNTYQVSKIGISNRGLQQGDGLLPLLFNIALEYALRHLSVDVNLSAHLHIRSNHWLCI
jgi:hypothetical protein